MIRKVKELKQGEFVRRVRKDGTPMSKVYCKDVYDRSLKRYWLDDTEDISKAIAVRPDTLVLVGFTY